MKAIEILKEDFLIINKIHNFLAKLQPQGNSITLLKKPKHNKKNSPQF